jgi:serine/threonine protein kinase
MLRRGERLDRTLKQIDGADDDTETPFGKRSERPFYLHLAKAFADVADGLQHAHSRGVIHRDIKPSNLILDAGSRQGGSFEGKLRVLDFGLARLEGQETLTLSGDVMGTVLYMSPEQAMAKRIPLDHRTDVYSLGATMYEVLAGEPPFRGKDQNDTLSQIIGRDPRSPRQLNPAVPKDLETMVLKCLRKDPADRYGTAEALAQDLRRFVRGDPIEAKAEGRWERTSLSRLVLLEHDGKDAGAPSCSRPPAPSALLAGGLLEPPLDRLVVALDLERSLSSEPSGPSKPSFTGGGPQRKHSNG